MCAGDSTYKVLLPVSHAECFSVELLLTKNLNLKLTHFFSYSYYPNLSLQILRFNFFINSYLPWQGHL